RRVVIALGFLLLSKVVAVLGAPLFGAATDVLAGEGTGPGWLLGAGAVGITIAYGFQRLMNVGFQQLRDVVFAKVGQRALRM
ncbi:MAG: metal ABC transporter permease, partial [Litoreibacter sp.]|nr:metal ABC transporter permease [Litoreibacter sp.]